MTEKGEKMDKRSLIYIVLAGITWGMASIFVNTLSFFGFTPTQISAIRNVVAAIIICIYAAIKNPKIFKAPIKEIVLFIISGTCIYLTNAFYYISMKMTSPSTAVVLMYLAPIIVMIISVVFMGEKLTLRKFFSIIGAFLGCALVTGVIGGIRFSVMGIIIGALSGITYSIYCIFAKIQMRRGDDALCATAYCFITAGILSLVFSNPANIIRIVSVAPLKIIPVALLMGVCVGALPYFLYTLASKKLSASTASAMATIEPLTGTIVSVTVFNEVLSLGGIIGIVLILGSVIVLSYCKD